MCREFDQALDGGDVSGLPGHRRGRHRRRHRAATIVIPEGLARIQAFLEAISLVTDLDAADGEVASRARSRS